MIALKKKKKTRILQFVTAMIGPTGVLYWSR
jgi:hypothetical protein